jgi:hypothetical protein
MLKVVKLQMLLIKGGNLEHIKSKIMKIKRSELKRLAINKFGNDSLENQKKIASMISVACCARVSYTVVGEEGKEPNYDNDIKLHDRLLESGHFSPFEHCAKVMSNDEYNFYSDWKYNNEKLEHVKGWCNNFKGFIPYRYLIDKK